MISLFLQVVSEREIFVRPAEMPRRGETSIQSERATTDESVKKIEVVVPTPLTQLSATNYCHWGMGMEVHLDAQGLWEAVTGSNTNKKKDRLPYSQC